MLRERGVFRPPFAAPSDKREEIMIACGKCGHQNLPSYQTCSRCGTALNPAAAQAQDDYRRLLEQRAAEGRKKRVMFIGIGLVAVGVFAWRYSADAGKKAEAQAVIDFVEQWAGLEKRETGLFWNCVMAGDVDVGMFQNANQIQQRIEGAYAAQSKTFPDHILTECLSRLERAQQAFAGLSPPASVAQALEAYKASLPELKASMALFAERLKNRKDTKDVDSLIQEFGNAWHIEMNPTPQTIAFEKFLHCAVPGLSGMKDAQEMLEFLADACYKKDPVAFMDRVRKECGPIVENPDPAAKPSKSYKLTNKRFYEEEARMLAAWDSCGRRSQKGKKSEDLGEFLIAVGDYMQARAAVVKVARELEGGPSGSAH